MNYLIALFGIATAQASIPPITYGNLSYESDVRPIMTRRCEKCHNGTNQLPNILKYEVAFQLREEIKARVSGDRSMPKYGQITESERNTIKRWVEQGAQK
jgi:uncharacterized membrane protein